MGMNRGLTNSPSVNEADDLVRRQYGDAIGRHRTELTTPALVLDLPAAKRNIAEMAGRIRLLTAELRPHIKVHKNPELARLQIAAGAIGLSCATVWEAAMLAASGLDHLFIVNQVEGEEKVAAVAQLGRRVDLMVAVDDRANAERLAAAARAAGSSIGVLVEVNTGMDRCGVDTDLAAVDLARFVSALDGLHFLGVTGYEGHCSMILDRTARLQAEQAAMASFVATADAIESAGLPCRIRSAGGTATWSWTASFGGVTEIQAGTYVVMDNDHSTMIDGFELALTVQARVISRSADRLVVDAGGKSIGAGEFTPIRLLDHPNEVLRFDEEHGIFRGQPGFGPQVGESVALVPGYAPSTVNLYDAYHVVEDDIVTDIWPVIPRGPGHHGLLGELLEGAP